MGERRGAYRILVGNLIEDHSKNPGIDGRKILKCIFRKQDGSIDWIHLPQYRDRW
jgi:hypothetical protein